MTTHRIRNVFVAAALSAICVVGHAQDLPNIIVIMPDDLGWGDVGYNGSEIRTPAIDQLAEEGIVLTRYYTHPTCSPTRSSFYTGKRALSLGTVIPFPPWVEEGLQIDEKLLPQYLKDSGYMTWLVGKWHLGHTYYDQHPRSRGYDHFYGAIGPEINYYTHALNGVPDWERNGEALDQDGYATHLFGNEAVELLSSYDGDAPFFMHYSPTAPHAPLQAPQEAVDAYASFENFNRRRLAAMVSECDTTEGNIVAAVRRRDDADNTLIVFVSDNGGDVPAGASSGALRGGKSQPYDGGIRVPAIAWWPARLGSGSTDEFISVHDWVPTLAALARAQSDPDLPGIDVWPALNQEPLDRADPIVIGAIELGVGPKIVALDQGWKLIRSVTLGSPNQTPGDVELYNLNDDPAETMNVAAVETERVERIQGFLNTVPIGRPRGVGPPPPGYDGATSPEVEPNNRAPIYPPRSESIRNRP